MPSKRRKLLWALPILAFWGWSSAHKKMPEAVPAATSSALRKPSAAAKSAVTEKKRADPGAANHRHSLKIAAWIQQDRYCDREGKFLTDTLLLKSNPQRKLIFFDAFTMVADAPQRNGCTRALFASERGEICKIVEKREELACRLILALLLTDQWEFGAEGKGATPSEKEEGREILRSLAAENAGNGFFSLFLLGATEDNDEAGREDAYHQMLRAERFENPLLPLFVEIKEMSQKGAAALLYGVELNSSFSMPNYGRAFKAAKELARKGLYAEEFSTWVALVEARFLQNERQSFNEPFANALEDALLRSLLLAGKQMLEKVPLIFEQKEWMAYYRRRTLPSDHSTWITPGAGGCEKTFAEARAIYPKLREEFERQAALWRY